MIPIPQNQRFLKNWRFIDLFAGIGGFHYALKSFGAECVLAAEIDEKASKQYYINHRVLPEGNVCEIKSDNIPTYDILCAGFPCQTFSISGKQEGFNDPRGSLFFEIIRIVQETKPNILILENVKNINRHNNGETISTIISKLEEENYTIFIETLNTSNFGLPQNRERTFFIGFRKSAFPAPKFRFPTNVISSKLADFLEDDPPNVKFIDRQDVTYFDKQINYEKSQNRPLQIGKISLGRQGERIYHINGHAVTLSASGGGIGAKTGIYLINDKLRKLTGKECARIQGFPETYTLPKSELEAHKQFGNSISVDVVQYILEEIGNTIKLNEQTSTTRVEHGQKWLFE